MLPTADNLAQQDLVRYRNDSSDLSLALTHPDTGAAFTPTGNTLIWTLKAKASDADTAALVQKISTVGGITVANPSIVSLVPADFAALDPEVTYEWAIRAQNVSTLKTLIVARGTLAFAYDVAEEITLSIATTTTNPDAGFTWAGMPDKPSVFAADTSLLGAATAATNASGDTALALGAGQFVLAAAVTFTGTAGTRTVSLGAANAQPGALIALRLIFPATSGIICQVRDATSGGTLLATITSDGTAGTVGALFTRGASAWQEPTTAAWID